VEAPDQAEAASPGSSVTGGRRGHTGVATTYARPLGRSGHGSLDSVSHGTVKQEL
jgi:hypothetical protein